MPIETYTKNPALRPTVLARDVLKNVYRPSGETQVQTPVQTPGPDASEPAARDLNRAA